MKNCRNTHYRFDPSPCFLSTLNARIRPGYVARYGMQSGLIHEGLSNPERLDDPDDRNRVQCRNPQRVLPQRTQTST